MEILNNLLNHIVPGRVIDIRVGMHWTAVVIEVKGIIRCGLASTVSSEHNHNSTPDVPLAGQLLSLTGKELAEFSLSNNTMMTSLGLAAINAQLPLMGDHHFRTINAESIIVEYGRGKNVAIIGRFPFINRLKKDLEKIFVVEMNPEPGEYSPEQALTILPGMDIVAITGMTLINHTFESIIRHCNPKSVKLMLGPTTPIHPMMFDYGLDLLSGSVVENVDSVINSISQGANFRQIHQAGVKLITMTSDRLSNRIS